ncbi:MAG: SCO family protein [Pseudomonadota bacterium]
MPVEPPLAGAKIGGEFELSNTSGETVRWSDFEGRYRIVYFGFTYCPDICPTDMQRTIQGLEQFGASEPELAAKVQPIFISVDPERDTPEVMDQFTNAFSPDLIGLIGTPNQIADAASKFVASYTKVEGSSDDNYLVDHTRTVLLFGPSGEPLAILPSDLGADAVTQELARWVT